MMSSIVNVLTGVFEAIIIFMFLDTYVERKHPSNIRAYLCAILILSIMINLSNKILNLGLLNFIFVIISTFVIAYIHNRNIKMNLILAIISVLILAISEIIVLFMITIVADVTVKQVESIESFRLLGIILSKLFAFFILKLFCIKHKKNHIFMMKTSYWILFLIMFITSVMTIFLIFRLQYESTSVILNNMSIWCSIGLLYTTFFALYLYENISKQVELESKQEIFKQQIKAQSKHLDEILITQRQIKKIRHDLINHNISLQAFFENKDYLSGLEYLKNMNNIVEIPEDTLETGNIALDAIINTKRSIAISKNISFVTNIQIPENVFVDPIDICIIFGNALDNAIEACEKIQNNNKKIAVSIVYEDDSIICKIANTAIKSNNHFLHTTKKDSSNHGFGIGNIESALSKYKHICRFKQTEDEFILSFVIFDD